MKKILDEKCYDHSAEYIEDIVQDSNNELEIVEFFLLWAQERNIVLMPDLKRGNA